MTKPQFYILLAIGLATLYIVARIGSGLQSAQATVSKVASPLTNLFKDIGVG